MDTSASPLHLARLEEKPELPEIFLDLQKLEPALGKKTSSLSDGEKLKDLFAHTYGQSMVHFQKGLGIEHKAQRVGVVLSGGQAPGGHNVINGLYEALTALHKESKLYGFLQGPSGLVQKEYLELSGPYVRSFLNQGGFDMIGSGRSKIETDAQFQALLETVEELDLTGLVVIGGDDSNTNAALIAEFFAKQGRKTKVVGVPKTIDGDLKTPDVPVSFGFDTACKIYSELIGNIARDCFSAKKYYHFIKLMGRSASHITLECALQCQPNMALISEEIEAKNFTLQDIVNKIAKLVCQRAEQEKDYGVILVPEGLIEFIPEVKQLIRELNELLAAKEENIVDQLGGNSRQCFELLPQKIQNQLLLDRDPHGNVQVSRIDTEQLLIELVKNELEKRKKDGRYKGKFSTQHHFLGYEGRSALPSHFDSHYCYSLGYVAAALLSSGMSGFMAAMQNLCAPVKEWKAAGIPLTSMMQIERRSGKDKPVIRKTLVDINDVPFKEYENVRDGWAQFDCYRYTGPVQFYGPKEIVEGKSLTLRLEATNVMPVLA